MSRIATSSMRLLARPAAATARTGLARRVAAAPTARAFTCSATRYEPNPVTRPHLLPEFSLQDKVVVVSGGARGLGLVQAEALLEAGATVHCVDRLSSPLEDPTSHFSKVAKRAQEELGTTLKYHQIDVRNVPQLNETFTAIADESGKLDGLIAAAGINFESPALDYTVQETERLLSINVTGCFMTAQAAARQMVRLKTPGSICMIASMSGTIANRGMFAPVYNASKSAVLQLGRSLASEWGEYGIRVNTLSPGYIQTEMLQNLFDVYPERKAKWAGENMLGRISDPPEFRGAAVFLISDASSFMTGADLRIDGGHAAW